MQKFKAAKKETAVKQKARLKENKANMKVLCKDANELAPIPSTDIPSSMEIEQVAPLSESKFRVGDLVRNRIFKSLQKIKALSIRE